MAQPSKGFRECYRHPGRPAIRDCLGCGRPICRECERESGDPLLCLPCKEPSKPDAPAGAEEISAPQPFLPVGEVTVRGNGSVDGISVTPAPGPPPGAPSETESAETADTGGGRATADVPPVPPGIVPRPPTATIDSLQLEKEPEEEEGGTPRQALRQVLYALPLAVAACIFAFGFWLLFAYFRHRWTQVSVFTAGMLVPLVLYKSTTIKTKLGRKVWKKPPPPLYLSITSTAILLVFTPVFEVISFYVTYRLELNPTFSNFSAQYLRPLDWVLIVCGLGLSFVFPFFLKLGEKWPWPSRKNR